MSLIILHRRRLQQTAEPAYITLNPNSYDTNSSASTFSITVDSNVAWTATSENTFLTITSGASGSGLGTINVSVAEHTAETVRTGNIRVEGGGIIKYVGVNQAAGYVRPTTGLVADYNFNEVSGNLIDSIGGHHGVVSGSMVRDGEKYTFNGSNTHIIIPDSDDFSFMDANGDVPFTMVLDITFPSFSDGWVINKRDNTSHMQEWQIFVYQNKFRISLLDGSGNAISRGIPTSNLDTNTKYQVVFRYDGSGNRTGLRIDINAHRADTLDDSSATYGGMNNTGSSVEIGKQGWADGYFDGSIGHILVYKNYRWTNQEVTTHYNESL